ncbi:MAG: sigma-54-dependent Fis family transcriptional regulator, partial [Mesorhizobium sp.]
MKREIAPNQMKIDALPARRSLTTGQMALSNIDYDEHATMRAWESFLADEPKCAGDAVHPSYVRSLIHDSWYR